MRVVEILGVEHSREYRDFLKELRASEEEEKTRRRSRDFGILELVSFLILVN